MKKILLYAMLAVITFGCAQKEDSPAPPTLVGQWRLTQVLADPGDGSGVFRDSNNGKLLQFMSDGKVLSSTPLCAMNSLLTVVGDATYDTEFIYPKDCQSSGLKIGYKIEGESLILYYPCIEACAEKYVKEASSGK